MGKRELLLTAAFAFLGIVLYQVTAPPSQGPGFSFRGALDSLRRNIGPRHEYLGDDRSQSYPAGSDLSDLRISDAFQVKAQGTDQAAVVVRSQVYSTGANEEEARALAKQSRLQSQRAGDVLSLSLSYPQEGRQRAMLELQVPKRISLRVSRTMLLDVRDVASLELDNTRGEALVSRVSGPVRGTHSGGQLTVEQASGLAITARRADVTANRIAGDMRLDLTAGAFRGRELAGRVDVDANRVSIELDRLTGQISADLTQGDFSATGLSQPVRIDARGTSLRLEFDKAVEASAFTTDETIEVRLPPTGGVTFDINVEDGDVRLPEGAPAPTVTDRTRRVSGPFRGGGPTLSLRTAHGDVVVR